MTAKASGGGGAPRPVPAVTGPVPADLTDLLPKGFELPEGVQLVYAPPPTPEQQVAGAVEHASMCAGLYEAGLADLAVLREHAAGMVASQEAGVARLKDDAEAAEKRARDIAGGHGIEIGGPIPAHPLFAHLREQDDSDSDGGAA